MIFDCFTYFNDDLITDLRLNTLDQFVDKFIIVEATTDHAGVKKELNFKLNKYEKFKDKIRYIVVDDLPKNTKPFYYNRRMWHKNMVREEYQRNQIMRGLYDAEDEDLIIISDNDEIPNLENIKNIKIKNYAVFNQKFYRYKFNLLSEAQTPYQGSRIVKKRYLKGRITPQWLRHQYTKRIKPWQIHRYFTNPQVISDGGWHFSFMISPEKIRFKMKAYGHGELNTEKFTDVNYIRNRIDNHMDVFSDTLLKKKEVDDSFPSYIKNNREKFKEFLV
jgi:beta-1,4-mannosyl-glycoprotein beta-1,4-N-acetylglucosaminyltransferase